MKLIQINVWGGRVSDRLLDFISSEQPDFLCLQEVISYNNGDSLLFAPLEEIKEAGKFSYVSFGPKLSFNYMQGTAQFGNAILSNHKIIEDEVEFTNLSFVDNFNFESYDYNIRNLIRIKVLVNSKPLQILTHHGHHIPGHKNGDNETLRQCGKIAKKIDAIKDPIILTGDFNLTPSSESLEPINKRLSNLSLKYCLETTRNILTNKSEVCDYIFISKGIKENTFTMSDNVISDHNALIMEFDI